MRRRDFITSQILIALCVFPLLAKSEHAPLPEEVMAAKTIYLQNKTGTQNILDDAYQQFERWGRFKITGRKSEADLIVVFTHRSGLDDGSTVGYTQMEVFPKGSTDPAYEATERFRPFPSKGSAKNCVEDFRRRIKER